MRIVIGGASGFLGRALTAALAARGDDVVRLARRSASGAGEVIWDPKAGELDADVVAGADAVVNLGGVGIGDKRWTEAHKRAVLESRLQATGTLAAAIVAAPEPPAIFVSSSAIGYYGDRGDEILAETSESGPDSFYVGTTVAWEEAADPVADAGIPLAVTRTALVLDEGAGILPRVLLPIKLGVGGPLGDGRQWLSWISLRDWVQAMIFIIDGRHAGAFNLAAPGPVRQRDFAKIAAGLLNRPAFMPAPKFALRLVLGAERADHLLFSSTRVMPEALTGAGFEFADPTLETALASILEESVARRR